MLAKSLVVMPEIALLIAASTILMVSLFSGRKSDLFTYILSLATLLGMVLLILPSINKPDVVLFGEMYVNDELAKLIKLLVCVTVAVIFIYARPYLLNRSNSRPEFYILGLFATLGMLVMASAQNFITIYLGLELLSLCLYALVAYLRDSNDAAEAAIKYFVLGAIASGMLLYGMSIMYGITGTLSLSEISIYLVNVNDLNIGLIFALTFIVVGVAFKFGAVPFHMWVPDVYQGAPTAVTLFIATAPKFAAFVMAIRLLSYGMQELVADWQQMLMILAVLSLILGNIIAIAQSHIKRMLAYSTISHIGFVLLGFLSGENFGYASALFYTVIYVLMAAGAFGVLLLLNKDDDTDVDNLSELKGLGQSHPRLAFIMLLIMFSMAGMPLTVGFYAKLYVLQSLVYNDFIWLAILAVIMSIIGAFYYLRVIKLMYFDDLLQNLGTQNSLLANTVISVNGLLIVGLFIYPNYLLNYCVNVFQ
ncbi:MAG: NADH-quinone oxidoreductase subunit NuoN [Gammaproteobacteria bacterium]|nr:NADH-quinone oxidoreductase subunit NuoN [Gammaproteobacteria bacterium]NNC66625.1 NADH-quinone oxidoreductase subunit NuoN [Gammaproteobacteria bacterium]